MDITTVVKMHMDDLPAWLKFSVEPLYTNTAVVLPPEFIWVIITNLRMIAAYLTLDEAHLAASGIERAYVKSLLPLAIIELVAQQEIDLGVLIDEIIEHGLSEEADRARPVHLSDWPDGDEE
ncbi:hypothetical protein [Pseudomonas sp. dw_358]|uniref:hypothetical protein n=1 Tax=Pseudomonas sp. dw_358 TaxID=2720083 RepID=UPI001BD34DB0|nr:hypothetical protein [Pseudomonas sp. dw_358]